MLFGHIENRLHRIDHMIRLKRLQEETGGFNAFIPLVYQRQNNYLNVKKFLTGIEILKTVAVSRIILDNIPHIKAYWPTFTLNLALVAQEYGADDIDGTIQKESIQSSAGAASKNGLDMEELIYQIKDAGFVPVERDSLYNEIKVYK
ncbi:MAG: aminofutalosine synthase MqnE, partial [Nautiliaceae bacterium]